jgi:integrase
MPGRRQHGEGSIYERPARGGRAAEWIAVADLGRKGGKRDRREFGAPTMEAAKEKRDKFLAARREGFTLPRGRKPYVSEWLLHWVNTTAKRRTSPTSWPTYRQKITAHSVPFFEGIYLHEVDEEDVEAWHGWLDERTSPRTGRLLSPSTIKDIHVITSMAIGTAVVRKRLPHNPFANVSPPHADEPDIEPPTVAETLQILDRCRSWPRGARWITGITTGLRQGEVLALEWPNVRLSKPAHLKVEWSVARPGGEFIRKRPKSQTSRRQVPLPRIAVRALEAHRAAIPVRQLHGGLVFPGAGGGYMHASTDRYDWDALLDDIGMPHYRVHDARHAYATMLLEQGVDPRVVQAMLGHSSLAMLKRYQHVRQVMHQRAADAIDDALGDEGGDVGEVI